MTPRSRIAVLRKSADRAFSRIAHYANAITLYDPIREVDRVMAFVTIELLNTWTNFSRAYYLSSILNLRSESGRRWNIAMPISTFDEAIRVAVNLNRPSHKQVPPGATIHRRDEPTWHDPYELMRFVAHIGHSNLTGIQNAFSGGTSTLRDLPVFRNYFAHRNRGSKQAAIDIASNTYGIVSLRPACALLDYNYGHVNRLIDEWIEDMRDIMVYLCR
jgi:hypothetical protein